MIKNIIYVEDGSVDVDELTAGLDETSKVIVYRQGSQPPKIEQLQQPINDCMDSVWKRQDDYLDRVKKDLEKCGDFKMSKKLRNLLTNLYADLFC